MDASHRSFSDFLTTYLKLYRPPLAALATYRKQRDVLTHFAKVARLETLVQFTTESVCDYVQSRAGGNVNTTRSHLRVLKTASLYAHEAGWLAEPVRWRRLMPRAARSQRVTHHGFDQMVRVLDYLERGAVDWHGWRLYAIAATVAYTGLRKGEVLSLHREDVDRSRGVLWVSGRRRLKTLASAAPVPLPEELGAVLGKWMEIDAVAGDGPWLFPGAHRVGPWRDGPVGQKPLDRLRAEGNAAGVAGLGFHTMRHTLATTMLGRWGCTRDQVRTVLRHTNPATTEGYLHRDELEGLRAIGRRITFRPPPPGV